LVGLIDLAKNSKFINFANYNFLLIYIISDEQESKSPLSINKAGLSSTPKPLVITIFDDDDDKDENYDDVGDDDGDNDIVRYDGDDSTAKKTNTKEKCTVKKADNASTSSAHNETTTLHHQGKCNY